MEQTINISENPDYLLHEDFDHKRALINGIHIGMSALDIPLADVYEIYVIDKEHKNVNFAERQKMLAHYRGWIHMVGQMSLGIDQGKVISISFSENYILPFISWTEASITSQIGEPVYWMEDALMWGLDYDIHANIMVYREKCLYFHFNPKNGELLKIEMGEIDESKYE